MSQPAPEKSIVACPHCATKNRVPSHARGVPQCARCHEALPWIVTSNEARFVADVSGSMPVLVDFWAAWCMSCRQLSPIVERIATEQAGRLKLVKVNVDENRQVASQYGAMSIPLLVLFRDGREISRQVGALPASQLNRWLDPYLAQKG